MDVKNTQNLPSVLPEVFLRERLNGLLEHGLPQGYFTGIKDLDDICRLDKARLVTVTGIPGSGKSEFVDFLTTDYNKRYGLKTLYFSPENSPVEFHLEKLIRKFTCKPLLELTEEERETAISYVLANFYFFNCYDVTKLKEILATAEEMVVEKQIDILVLDPYNRIDVEHAATDIETQYISKILDELSKIALKHNLIVFLVAHPRKMPDSQGRGSMPSAYDINGSAHFFNKSDFVLIVHRNNRSETLTTVRVDKVKFSNYGHLGKCELEYDYQSGNYFPASASLPLDDNSTVVEDTTPKPFIFPKRDCNSPLDVMVSVYPGVRDTEHKEAVLLKDFLMTEKYKNIAIRIREGATPDERHELKQKYKGELPCVTPSGLFSKRDAASLIQHSGLICIDIDGKDNTEETMARVPSILRRLPYVAYASKSISGNGFFAIVPISRPSHHLAHYLAIEKEFKEQYGIVLDHQCKDVCRLRFATYDENPYHNPKATQYYQEYTEPTKAAPELSKQGETFTSTTTFTPTKNKDYDVTRSLADLDQKIKEVREKGIVVDIKYDWWNALAMSLATLGEEGRERFHAISSTASNYDKDYCDYTFSYACEHYQGKNQFTLRTAHMILNNAIKEHHV